MPATSNRQASVDSRRIALEREVTIRVPRFDTFVTEYSTNISTTGMFIVSEKPHAPGTTFTFEFSVADDWKLIRGQAQVVWTRYRTEDADRPAGMGVRFVELDAQSRRLIRWIVEKHIREGGKPFELDELRSVIDEALEDVIDADEEAESGTPQTASRSEPSRPVARRPVVQQARSSERKLLPLVGTAAAVVLVLAFLFWLTEWAPDQETAAAQAGGAANASGSGSPESAGSRPGSGVAASAPAQASGPVSASTSVAASTQGVASIAQPPLGSAYDSVREALSEWSNAWSAQDVDGYLNAYSRQFQPNGLSRSAWEAQRRERLTAPEFIKVSVSRLELARVRDDLIEVSFFQTYRSDRYSDSVEKVFELVWEDGSWKILSERTR